MLQRLCTKGVNSLQSKSALQGFQHSTIGRIGIAKSFTSTAHKDKIFGKLNPSHLSKSGVNDVFANQNRNIGSLASLWKRDNISQLQLIANANPQDSIAQENLMKVLVTLNPKELIERYESGIYVLNEKCKEYYIKALLSLSQIDKFVISKDQENTSTVSISPLPSKSSDSNPLHVMMVSTKQEKFFSLLRLLASISLPLALLYLWYSVDDKNGDNAPVTHAHTLATSIDVKFSDVKGVDEAKEDLEEVVEYLKNPEKFTRLGAKLPKGVLLVGEPGTGKTMLARAVAGEAGVPFLYASGSSFDEMYVGVGPRRIRDLFDDARKMAPCIIFIDELDAVGVARKYNMSGSFAKESTLNQLLTEMDGFKQTEGIIVIAATNLPDTLDPALKRPGRFDKQVVVPAPDINGRRDIINHYLKKTFPSRDVDSELIARGTTGFTGAELSNLINLAAIKAAIAGNAEVDMKTIEEARDDIIMGGKKRGVVQTELDKKLTAYHEGGHALVALYSDGALPIHKATIIQRGNALGTTSFLPERDEVSISRKQMISRLKVAMGGRAAEELIFGEDGITTGASSDFANATRLARNMVSRLGFSEKVGNIYHDGNHVLSEREMQLVDSEVKELLQKSYAEAKKILKEHEKELHLLANSLLEHETLTSEDIKHVISGKPLPKSIRVPTISNDETDNKSKGNNNVDEVKIPIRKGGKVKSF